MAADGLGPAAQDGFQPVGQVFGFFGVRHQGHARRKFGLALEQGAAKLQDLFQHAADGRCQSPRGLEGNLRRRLCLAVDRAAESEMPGRCSRTRLDRRGPTRLGRRFRVGRLGRRVRTRIEAIQPVARWKACKTSGRLATAAPADLAARAAGSV